MTSGDLAQLSVDLVANDKVSAVLTKLESQLDRANASASRAGAGIGTSLAKGTRQASDSTLTLAQAQARLLSTTGQNQAAFTTLSGALGNNSGSQLQNVRAATQLAQIQNRLSGQSQSLTSLFGQLGGQLGALGGAGGQAASALGSLAGSFGTLGGIGAAIGFVKVGTDLAIVGANADLVRQRFDGLATAAGTTGEALLKALRSASGGEITDLNLELAANRAQILGVAKSADEMSVLLAIARDRAQQLGTTSAKAFDDLVTGLGRGSPLILDNLGIMVSVQEANDKYAASLGTVAGKLTEAQQKQALINAVLEQGRASIAATGGAVDSAAGSFARAGAALENIKNNAGSGIATSLEPLARVFSDLTLGMDATSGNIATFAVSIGTLIGEFNGLMPTIGATREANQQFADSLLQFIGISSQAGDATAAGAAAAEAYAAAIERGVAPAYAAQIAEEARAESLKASAAAEAAAAQVAVASTGAMIGAADGARQHTLAAQQATSASLGYADALAMTGVQARAAAMAAEQKANADQVASVDAQTHATAQNALAQQAQLAANVLLAAGSSGASAAAVLAGSSSQVDVLTAAYYRLAAAQAAAGQAATKAALNKQTPRQLIGADSDVAGIRGAKHDAVVEQRQAQIKAARDAAEAERNYQQVLGNTGPALSHAKDELAQLTKGSAAYIDKQAEIVRLQQQADAAAKKGAKGGGGGGAGAAKLSDQTKLQNTLLASQEQYAQKSEQAEADHLDRILSITADFNKRIAKAQQDFGDTQLDSRASFYDQLGGIEDAGLRDSMAAQYEQAFAEAQQIAATKGADVADEFLKAKQAALQAQAQRASEIAQATKEGDKDKAEYLAGVDKLYREAEERKVAAAAAGNESLASERDAALAEESQKYSDAQAKIGETAEQAAQRKILAAERAGQAVDAEGLKVDGLITKYDALAAAGSRAGVAPAPTGAPSTTTSTAAAAAAVPTAPGDLAAALNSLRDAIGAVERATNAAGDKVASAVRTRFAS